MKEEEVLIVDDDIKLCGLMEKFLKSRGFAASSCNNGESALKYLKEHSPSIILLDVMMPGMDGFDTLRNIRKDFSTPIIMLTARGETFDKVVGLELGADDYVPKPFEPVEIEARIHAVLRRLKRNPDKNNEKVSFCGFLWDKKKKVFLKGSEPLSLTGSEYLLLEYLLENSNMVISRSQIMEFIKGDDFDPFQRNIDILISRLRKKLEDNSKDPRIIKTVHGRGYMLVTG